ncbi:MAG: carboxypeptidase-like regulatory domain-containing protein [Proteiniphilum sp.]
MKKKQLILILFLLPALLFSQETINVKGVIVDGKGEPVIGATIIQEEDSSVGTISDVDGQFSLSVPANSSIEISYIGYVTQMVEATGDFVRIVLLEDTKSLDELVVIGYGTVRKSDLTGSVTSLKSDELNKGVTSTMTGL